MELCDARSANFVGLGRWRIQFNLKTNAKGVMRGLPRPSQPKWLGVTTYGPVFWKMRFTKFCYLITALRVSKVPGK
jgi:hypothetical protein